MAWNWALGEAVAIGGGKGKGGGGIAFYKLLDVDNQVFYPLLIAGAGVGVGIPFQFTVGGAGSYAFFTVPGGAAPPDFNGRVVFASVLDVALFAGMQTIGGLTFWGVDHDPYWIDTSGLENGISISLFGVSFGVAFVGDPVPNKGCAIRPTGDPLCGGYSRNVNHSEGTMSQ